MVFLWLLLKKLHLKSIIYNALVPKGYQYKVFTKNGVKIWDAWADANGDLGPFMASNGATGTVKRLIKSQN
jgi:thymidylate synthase